MNHNVEKTALSHQSLRASFGAVGPGLLFAAAAVGVSHLVHATQAGASYGLGMFSIIIIACLTKYPAIRFGGDYASATGKNLIQSYRQSGLWVLLLYGIAQIFSMCFVISAVSLVTVGLIKSVFDLALADTVLVAFLLTVVTFILISGRFHLLEKLTKIVVPIFTLLIVVATLMVVSRIDWSISNLAWPEITVSTTLFIIVLGGFMPAPVDSSVLQSLWVCAKAKDTGALPTMAESRFDFNVGFVASLILALCFLLLGAGVMHGTGVPLAKGAAAFSSQVIELFTNVMGQWTYPLIAVASITVMFSTLMTLLDGYPRIVASIIRELSPKHGERLAGIPTYDLVIVLLCFGSVTVITLLMNSFSAFINLTSVIVFVLGPVLAYLNHRAIFGEEIPAASRPGLLMKIWSIAGLLVMTLLGVLYFYLRATNSV